MHDGETTYCWHIPQPPKNTKLNETDRVDGFSGVDGCPMTMTVKLANTTVAPFENVNVTWTVHADFLGANKVNMTTISYGEDANGDPAQIVHSNVHTCVYGTGCDPFSDGTQLIDKTVNKIANLTDNTATFVDTIQFPETGEYSVLAHIIMPDTNASERFDYAVYVRIDVEDATTAPVTVAPTPTTAAPQDAGTTNEDSGGSSISTAAIIGIVVGGVVLVVALGVVAFIFRRRGEKAPQYAYMAPPPYEAVSDIYGGSKDSDHFHSEAGTAPSLAPSGKDTWGGGVSAASGSPRSSQNLDNTGGSTGSVGTYGGFSERSVQGPPPPFQGGFRPTSSVSSGVQSTADRPRRVDSDVEL